MPRGESSLFTSAGALTWLALIGSTFVACGSDPVVNQPAPPSDVEWVTITYGGANQVAVAVLRPDNYSDTGNHPVILALPWGQGTPDLVLGMIDAYWGSEAPRRGYVVISPAIRGTTLATEANAFLPELFDWVDANLSIDADRIALVGASNGGRGIFHALVSDPTRFSALIGMPGSYVGPAAAVEPFSGEAWLMVGENDTSWRGPADNTKFTLEAAGIPTTLDVLADQGHVLFVPQGSLMDWVDDALGTVR